MDINHFSYLINGENSTEKQVKFWLDNAARCIGQEWGRGRLLRLLHLKKVEMRRSETDEELMEINQKTNSIGAQRIHDPVFLSERAKHHGIGMFLARIIS